MNFLSIHWVLGAAIWYAGNGLLHDVFVLIRHKGTYDRELLRLLMDGHVLIFSGLALFATWNMMKAQLPYAGTITLIIAVGMIIYCAMIFPFLKSFATLAISLMLLIVSVHYMNSPQTQILK